MEGPPNEERFRGIWGPGRSREYTDEKSLCEEERGPGLRPTSSWNVPDGKREAGWVLGFLLFAKNGNEAEHQSPLSAWWQIPGREASCFVLWGEVCLLSISTRIRMCSWSYWNVDEDRCTHLRPSHLPVR